MSSQQHSRVCVAPFTNMRSTPITLSLTPPQRAVNRLTLPVSHPPQHAVNTLTLCISHPPPQHAVNTLTLSVTPSTKCSQHTHTLSVTCSQHIHTLCHTLHKMQPTYSHSQCHMQSTHSHSLSHRPQNAVNILTLSVSHAVNTLIPWSHHAQQAVSTLTLPVSHHAQHAVNTLTTLCHTMHNIRSTHTFCVTLSVTTRSQPFPHSVSLHPLPPAHTRSTGPFTASFLQPLPTLSTPQLDRCSSGGTFVTDNSNYIRLFFNNRPRCLHQNKSIQNGLNRDGTLLFSYPGRTRLVFTCVLGRCMLPQSY